MSVRAEWRLAELLGQTSPENDPFAHVVLSSGLRVDLTGTEDEIFEGLRQSVRLEAGLFNRGITCELKDGGQDCLTCPMYVADRAEEARAPLCRLGRDQRVLENRANAMSAEQRLAPVKEMARVGDFCSEMGHLKPQYVELLTAVGL